MHERSLAQTLIRQIDDELSARGLHRLQEVRLEIGKFAGVEPMLLASAFEELAADHWPAAVRLRWDVIPLRGRCRECAAEFFISHFRFACPNGDRHPVDVIAGEELRLVSLRAEPVLQSAEAST